MKEVFFKIHGRVQGVGFRHFVKSNAHTLGQISGWVCNSADGTVEVFARGPTDQIEALISLCTKGPSWSRVDRLEFLPGPRNYFLPPIIDGRFDQI